MKQVGQEEGKVGHSGPNGDFNSSCYSVVVVDDEEGICELLETALSMEGYQVSVATSGEEALDIIFQSPPNLIIADYIMPGMSGLELLETAREKVPDAARILCTGFADIDMAFNAINKGAVSRILSKPFRPEDLLAAVRYCLEEVRLREENRKLLFLTQIQNEKLSGWNRALEKEVAVRTAHIDEIVEASIYALAELAESRAQDIGGHLRRMQEFSRLVAERYWEKRGDPANLSDTYIRDLVLSTLLHDVGKVGIPDGVLFKPGKLTQEEFEVIKMHTVIGRETLRKAQARLGDDSFLSMGVEVAGYHHERWDGKGYPDGLAAEAIPLCARIVAIADVYDALTSTRVYKRAWSHEETMRYMGAGAGTQFDPSLIEILNDVSGEFRRIRESWKD